MTETWAARAIPNEPDIAFAVESGSNPVADIYASGVACVPHTEVVKRARLIAAAPEMFDLVNRVAELNPDAGEIGAGMLVQLVTEARAARTKATQP